MGHPTNFTTLPHVGQSDSIPIRGPMDRSRLCFQAPTEIVAPTEPTFTF